MYNPPSRSVLILLLLASVAVARESEPTLRNVVLPEGPDEIARPIHVAGAIATVLRFEKEVDPKRTELVGWMGRFEPLLVGGKKVVIEALYDLTSEDRFPLVVTLVDGTQVPFTVQAGEKGRVDHQVNLFWDPESDKYLRASLDNALWRERLYREENARYAQEENSPDHALATLLANGAYKQTPFRPTRTHIFKDIDTVVAATVYSGKGKVAVVFDVKNHDPKRSWSLMEARLTRGADFTKAFPETRKCAVRMTSRWIAAGASGAVAIVADKSAFVEGKRFETLALQLIRGDGRVQALVMLDPSLAR